MKKTVKAWALVTNPAGFLITKFETGQIYVYLKKYQTKSMAWFSDTVVPCTITYEVPGKKGGA